MVFDPGKKNRNFGTKKRGHGQDNRHVVPLTFPRFDSYCEALTDYRTFELSVGAKAFRFIVEVPHPEFAYALTPEDVTHLLASLVPSYFEDVDMFVFRQPTRRQRILVPVWGRIAFYADVADWSGLAIYFEAVPRAGRTWERSKSATPDDEKEYARLEALGVRMAIERRCLRFTSDLASDRAVQLYHTLPHELGHLDDYRRHDRYLVGCDDLEDEALEAERRIDEGTPHFDHKPPQEREVYAHRFSDDLRRELTERGVIPFERRFDEAAMRAFGLEAAWFEPTD